MTAIRETFEEAGLLIASSSKGIHPTESVLDEARKAVHAQKMTFGSFLSNNGLEADTSKLLPFSQWITPVTAPK
jgi:8-oxo-dGTP pyrophosphatase MutT (NUDIX family)